MVGSTIAFAVGHAPGEWLARRQFQQALQLDEARAAVEARPGDRLVLAGALIRLARAEEAVVQKRYSTSGDPLSPGPEGGLPTRRESRT